MKRKRTWRETHATLRDLALREDGTPEGRVAAEKARRIYAERVAPRRRPLEARRGRNAPHCDAPRYRNCYPPPTTDAEYSITLRAANRRAEARGRREGGQRLCELEML